MTLLTNCLDFQCAFQALSFLGYKDHQTCFCSCSKDEGGGLPKGLEERLLQALILFCSLLFVNWKPSSTFSKVNAKVKFLQEIPQERTLPFSLLNNHWTLTLCISKRNKEKTQLSTSRQKVCRLWGRSFGCRKHNQLAHSPTFSSGPRWIAPHAPLANQLHKGRDPALHDHCWFPADQSLQPVYTTCFYELLRIPSALSSQRTNKHTPS